MKNMIFAAMALVAVSFAGCSKDNGAEAPATNDNVVVVKLPDNVVAGTRAVEAPVIGGVGALTPLANVTVFLLNGDAVISAVDFAAGDITAKALRIENVSSLVNSVIVVANIPDADVAAVKALKSANAIKAYAFTVASQNADAGIVKKTLMSEVVAAKDAADPAADGHKYKEAVVTLNSLTARFEIGTALKGTGVSNIILEGVWINGYYIANKGTIKDHPSTDPVWDLDQTTGTAVNPFTKPAFATYTETTYFDKGDAAVDAVFKSYAYQVFAGANIPQVILCVRGQYTTEQTLGGNDKEFLGWVTFNKYYEGPGETNPITSVEANMIYKLSNITINADMITIKPNLKDFDLGVKVVLTPWTEKQVTPGV